MPVLLLFAALPLVEIALFVVIGGKIGVLGVLLEIFASGALGVAVLRGQRDRLIAAQRGALQVSLGQLLAEGAFRSVAGLLLIAPGFLTDALGLLLLVPLIQRLIVASVAVRAVSSGRQTRESDDIIEGEFDVHPDWRDPVPSDRRLARGDADLRDRGDRP